MTLWWIRRDLRLADNAALTAAMRNGPVVPVFVCDPALLGPRAHGLALRRQGFLFAGLRALDDDLRARGSRLVIVRGAPAPTLRALAATLGARGVVAEEDVSPYARRRDAAVGRVVALRLVDGVSVHHPRTLLKPDGRPYVVYTPFARAWRSRPRPGRGDLLPAPAALPPVPAHVEGDPLPAGFSPDAFPAGEVEALQRLARFTRVRGGLVHDYAAGRDRLDGDRTSMLSPYLRFGMLSARQAVVAADEAGGPGADVWLAELVWREFYTAILWHFPGVLRGAFDRALARVPWRRAPAELRAWQEGRTGYPIVDAAMRQLRATGWMPNRARMIVASFLVKDLLIDWRAGEGWFMQQLVDGDPAANNGGWQWVAGTGTDAAPYFRVFNPVLQAERCDPDGAYVRRWVPELARVPQRRVHAPWRLGPSELAAADVRIGRDYPAPIVEHGEARARTLAAYARARAGQRSDAR